MNAATGNEPQAVSGHLQAHCPVHAGGALVPCLSSDQGTQASRADIIHSALHRMSKEGAFFIQGTTSPTDFKVP